MSTNNQKSITPVIKEGCLFLCEAFLERKEDTLAFLTILPRDIDTVADVGPGTRAHESGALPSVGVLTILGFAVIAFPEFVGWTVFSAMSAGRDGIRVALIQNTSN